MAIRLTESRLRQIIREERARIQEMGMPLDTGGHRRRPAAGSLQSAVGKMAQSVIDSGFDRELIDMLEDFLDGEPLSPIAGPDLTEDELNAVMDRRVAARSEFYKRLDRAMPGWG